MITIIGAGITGLALARALHTQSTPYTLLEARPAVGGYIRSQDVEGYRLEYGPNSVLCDAATLDFLHQIGLKEAIVPANPVSKDRFIFRGGKYRKLPAGPIDLLTSGFFSWPTKWAVLSEMRRRSTGPDQETLSSFFRRRFCQEIVDYPLNTFVAGIYAGDPEQLLVEETFPVLAQYEREYGSVLKGFIQNKKSGARKISLTFKEGMQQLPQQLAQGLNIQTDTAVAWIERKPTSGFWVHLRDGQKLDAEQVVLALPAFVAAALIRDAFPDFARSLDKVDYPPMAVIHTAFPKQAIQHDLDGFGGLHPQKEGLFAAGSIWTSSVFDGRAPEGNALLTTFVGGALYRERALLPESEIKTQVTQELQRLFGIRTTPVFQHFTRWEKAIPQYNRDILPVYAAAKAAEQHGLWVAANWKGGISIADAIHKAPALARAIGDYAS
ncbi:MAG: protoporphyrinogen oxidase [Bernardetiaceae bacterium]